MLLGKGAILLLAFLVALSARSQTIVMNEVSQGESGGQEYVEFVIVDSTAVYDCFGTAPPCIDIRGWIIDDNSGYHGSSGIASGACRFSLDLLWSCVPLGTIIVIYNDADPNLELPSDDVSLTDGNCAIVAPISDPALFETNSTTPGAVACSYPATGWVPGGNWTNIVMANGGDCFRIVDLAGCEVFSLCWDDNNLNNLIYFPGGATSGASTVNTVYYFNDGDPTAQANWSIGCADAPACGLQEQTPGFPNNATNAAYIAQFNNGCTPITPIVVSAVGTDGCGCTGSANASASGSIPGYTYEWYDIAFISTGQATANATALCPGTYNVIGTSSIGCPDTATVVLTSLPTADPGTAVVFSVCSTMGITSLFGELGGTPDPGGVWSGPSLLSGGDLGNFDPTINSAGVYTYIAGSVPCQDSATVAVTVDFPGDPGSNGSVSLCFGDPATDLFLALGGTPDGGGSWSPALSSGTGTFDPTLDPAGTYTYSISATGTCPAQSAEIIVNVNSCCNSMDTIDYDSFEYSTTIPDIILGTTYHTTPQNWAVRTGASSVYMNFQNGFQGVVYDRVYDVCVGQTYQFSAWFSNPWGGVPDVDLQLTLYDASGAIIYQEPSLIVGGPWVQFNTGQFTAATTTIRFELINNIAGGVGNNDCSMDDLVLERCSLPVNSANAGLFCTTDPSIDLYGSILIPIGNGGSWIGPSVLSGGFLGTFDPSTNLSGTYTYTISGAGACPDSVATVDVVVDVAPQLDPILDVNTCNGYQLPVITGSNLTGNEAYYDGPSGTGTQYLPGQVITSPVTLFAFDGNPPPSVCSSEEQFSIVISSSIVDLGNDTTLCNGQAVTFDAGTGFDTYLWQDNSTNQSLTVSAAGVYWCEVGALGSNQVQNGDFELGDNFFTSGYTNGIGGAWGPLSSAGTYEVSTDPQLEHINFISCGDHTSGTGQMMVVNGSSVAGTNVWCQDVVVTPGTDYQFSTWISNAINTTNVAQLQFSIDGIPLGAVFSTSPTGCLWQEFSATWNSGASSTVTICINNQNIAGGGNDFMLDDIFFAPLCTDRDSVEVFIQFPPDAGMDGTINFCPADPPADLFTILGGTPDPGGTWSPALASGTGVFDPTIDAGATYTYTVSGGGVCPDASASVTVAVNAFSDATIDPVPDFCETNTTFSLSAATGSGVWSGVGIIDPVVGVFDPATALEGTHEIVYTIPGMCGSADTVFILVNAPVNAGSDSTIILCISDPLLDLATLIAPADPGGVWLPVLVSGTSTLDPLTDISGVYNYIVSGPGACPNDTASVDVTINALADATISIAGPFCPGDPQINLSAATGSGSWSGTGIINSVSGTFDPGLAGPGVHTITYTISGSCGAVDTELIVVNSEVDASVNAQSDICESVGSINLSAVNPGGIWIGLGIVNPSTGLFNPSLFGPGTYTIVHTIAGFCPTVDSVSFNVLPDLVPSITWPTSFCEDSGLDTLTVDLSGGVWSGSGITNATNGTFDPTVALIGWNEVIYTISGTCGGADTIQILVNQLPQATISVSDSLGCLPLTVIADYTTTSTLNNCLWEVSNGVSSNTCGAVTLTFDSAGCYDVQLSITDSQGCSQIVSYPGQICAVENPVSSFNYSPQNINEIEPLVDFTNLSLNASQYEWSIDNGFFNSEDVSYSFLASGLYTVCLIAENDIGCVDTSCQVIEIESSMGIYIPNAFTPDGDGTNDLFGPSIYGFDPEDYEFMIFNRWGQMIFYSQIYGVMWDGTAKFAEANELVQQDVYVWKLIFRQSGTVEKTAKIGHVSLLR